MKKVNIQNEINGMSFSAQFSDDVEMNLWISEQVACNSWGNPERISLSDEGLPDRVLSTSEISQEINGENVVHIEYLIKADYVIEIIDLNNNYEYLLAKCYENRRAAYPPIEDYVDGIVKGDQAQVQAYIDACLLVKATFPKPIME